MILCEGILFFIGLVFFVTAKVQISNGKLVTGRRARVIGVFFMLPIVIAVVTGLSSIGLYNPNGRGFSDAALIEVVIVFFCVLIGIIIGLSSPVMQGGFTPLTPILTPKEAARYLRVPVNDIYRLIETKQLEAVLVGKDYRISKDTLDALFRP